MKKILLLLIVSGLAVAWGAPARKGKGGKGVDVLKDCKCNFGRNNNASWTTDGGVKVLKLGGGPTNSCGTASFNVDLKKFSGQEVKMSIVYRLENAKKRPRAWDMDQDETKPEDFAPLIWHWARANAENDLYVHKATELPEGGNTDGWQTLEARSYILSDDDLSDASIVVQANIAKGGTLYVKEIRISSAEDVLMDSLVEKAGAKLPKTFKCEYSLPWKTSGKFRGIGMNYRCTQADLEKVVAWGVNLVRFTDFRPNAFKLETWEPKLAFLKEKGVRVVLSPTPNAGSDGHGRLGCYVNEKYLQLYCQGLASIAKSLAGRDDVWGIEILHEPEENVFSHGEDDTYSFWQAQYEAIKAIREVNPDIPLIASADMTSSPKDYETPVMRPFPFKDIWYNLRFYAPVAYTHYSKTWLKASPDGKMPTYPGPIGYKNFKWDVKRLTNVLAPVDAFQKKYGARFFVSEFAVFRRMPGAVQWMSDACELFEKRADMWSFRAYGDNHAWDLEYMEDAPYKDAQKLPDGQESARLSLLKKRWAGKAR